MILTQPFLGVSSKLQEAFPLLPMGFFPAVNHIWAVFFGFIFPIFDGSGNNFESYFILPIYYCWEQVAYSNIFQPTNQS